MKFIQIFIPVALLHLAVIAVILLQPGCQARQAPPPPAGTPSTANASMAATPSADYIPADPAPSSTAREAVNRQAPMRPAGQDGVVSDLPPAFNSNLAFDDGDPLLPPEEDARLLDDMEPVEMETYTIAPGDTLSGIARRFGVSVASLRNANNLSGDIIRAGEELMIPLDGSASGDAGMAVVNSGRDASGEVYIVEPGDNLTVIARRFGLTVPELRQMNNLSSDRIVVGQELYVPESGSAFTPPPAPQNRPAATNDGSTYVVAPGDTPITIARQLGVSWQELMRVNGISDPTRMKVGQVLIVPGGGNGAPAASPATTSRPPAQTPPPSTRTPAPLRTEPSRPAMIDNQGTAIDPDDLEAQMGEDVPVSPVEVVEPTGNGG